MSDPSINDIDRTSDDLSREFAAVLGPQWHSVQTSRGVGHVLRTNVGVFQIYTLDGKLYLCCPWEDDGGCESYRKIFHDIDSAKKWVADMLPHFQKTPRGKFNMLRGY